MKIKNKDLIQSYVLTTAKYSFSAYEKRILYRIVEVLQAETSGKKLNVKYSIDKNLFDDRDITMPISLFLKDEQDNNYQEVQKALKSLNAKTIEYDDGNEWALFNLIERPKINRYDSYVKLRLAPEIYDAFLNFSKGFRKYELKTAMSFESTYSMRFYELFSSKKAPISYSIDELKSMFKIEDKYARINDFKKFVIDRAKKELDKKAPYSFNYKFIKSGRSYTHILFTPFEIPKNRDQELYEKELNHKHNVNEMKLKALTPEVREWLITHFDFTTDGLRANIDLLREATAHELWADESREILKQVRKQGEAIANKAGYFINSWKGILSTPADEETIDIPTLKVPL